MRYQNFIFLTVLCVVLSCKEQSDRILPETRDIIESVYSSVTVQPDSLYQAYAKVSGILENNLVEEGDIVLRNQALIQIINHAPELNTQNAKYALNLAKENYQGRAAILNSIDDEIRAAQLKYKNDSINYFRQKKLWEQNIGSKVELDTKKLNYELASNNLNSLQSKFTRTKNELETAIKQAQINYEASLINTKDFTVNSKINGKVYALYKEPGEIVTTMDPLASIGSSDKFVIEMLVDEVDIVKIKKYQEVLIQLDAYNGEIFNATVSKIYPKKDERNQTFLIEANFNNPPTLLYPGLSGEANIIINKTNNVLTIPISYLTEDHKVKTEHGFVSVKTGIQNMEYIEIQSGISKDTYIYKPD